MEQLVSDTLSRPLSVDSGRDERHLNQWGAVHAIFKALAHEISREILLVLLNGQRHSRGGEADLSVSDIARQMGVVRPTVSRQLGILRKAGVVSLRRSGTFSYYRIEISAIEAVEDWLDPFVDAAT